MDSLELEFEFVYQGDTYATKLMVGCDHLSVVGILDANGAVPDNVSLELLSAIELIAQSIYMEEIADIPSDDNIH